jgi:hypothetical protein
MVDFGFCILVSALFHISDCACMRFRYLIEIGPTENGIAPCLVGSLTLPSGFVLVLEGRYFILELCNLLLGSLELRSKLGIGGSQGGYNFAI